MGALRKLLAAAAIAAVAAVAAVVVSRRLDHKPAPRVLHVKLAGQPAVLPAGTTLARAAALARLQPQAGDLLDANGNVLRAAAYPGRLLVDSQQVDESTRLQPGDRVTVRDGHDRRERLRREVVPVVGGLPPDPQFTLARIPGTAVVVRGALSSELVSARFVAADGPAPGTADVALTFDDGPSPLYTPQILRVLERLHAEATFFAVGYLAAAYPDLIREELAAGMDVGNHTYNHSEIPPFNTLPPALLDDQIALGAADLRAAGADPALFRPPGGSSSAAVVRAAERHGERVVLWSVDPGDWHAGSTAKEIAATVLRAVRPGSIVLLHDGGGDRAATVAALPAIVRGIRRRGLRLVTVGGA